MAGRIEDGRLLLDLRTVDPGHDDLLGEAVLAAAAREPGPRPAAGLTGPD